MIKQDNSQNSSTINHSQKEKYELKFELADYPDIIWTI